MFTAANQPQSSSIDYARINFTLLASVAAWAVSDREMDHLTDELTGTQSAKMRTQLNRDSVRVAMLVLAHRALNGGVAQVFSLRQLALSLDEPRVESMQRSLRNWMLPMLTQIGWIEGFVTTDDWSTQPHEIEITERGLAAVKSYLGRVSENAVALTNAHEKELCA